MRKVKSIIVALLATCLMFGTLASPAYAAPMFIESGSSDCEKIKWSLPTQGMWMRVKEAFEESKILNKIETIDEVPLYFQTDYPDVSYGNGTVATSGCGITCLSMVASYLTDTEILPDELARQFGSRRDSNIGRMEYASDTLGLTFEKEFYWTNVMQALKDGKVAIILVNEKTEFTSSQHLMVLTGTTEDGKIMVNDPYAPNYSKLEMHFENGFTESFLICGFQGAWIYEKGKSCETVENKG